MVQILKEVFSDSCPFVVLNREKFSGISVQHMAQTGASFVNARFNCDVKLDDDQEECCFCLSTCDFASGLESIEPNSCIKMRRKKGESTIECRSFESNSRMRNGGFDIACKDIEEQESIKSMEHSYSVNMNLDVLKKNIKIARDIKAEDIEFVILEPPDQEEITGGSETKFIFVRLSYGSPTTTKIFKEYRSVTQCEQNVDNEVNPDQNMDGEGNCTSRRSYIVKTIEEDMTTNITEEMMETLVEKYRSIFPVKGIEKFIKNMQRQTLVINLSNATPMVIHYPLGNEQSFVRLALTEKMDDSI